MSSVPILKISKISIDSEELMQVANSEITSNGIKSLRSRQKLKTKNQIKCNEGDSKNEDNNKKLPLRNCRIEMDSSKIKNNLSKVIVNEDDSLCTACHRRINVNNLDSVFKHPSLNVLICKKCHAWYTSGEIEQGEDGVDLQCQWCGDGGNIFLCNDCSNVFCSDCIKFNFGKKELNKVTNTDKWQCYICQPTTLMPLVEKVDLIINALQNSQSVEINGNNDIDESSSTSSSSSSSDASENSEIIINVKQVKGIMEKGRDKDLKKFQNIVRKLNRNLTAALNKSQTKEFDNMTRNGKKNKKNAVEDVVSGIKKISKFTKKIANKPLKSITKDRVTIDGIEIISAGSDDYQSNDGKSNFDQSKEGGLNSYQSKIKIKNKKINGVTKHSELEEDGTNSSSSSDDDNGNKDTAEAINTDSSGDVYNPSRDKRDEKINRHKERCSTVKNRKKKAALKSLEELRKKMRLKREKNMASSSGNEEADDIKMRQKRKKYRLRLCVDTTALRSWIVH